MGDDDDIRFGGGPERVKNAVCAYVTPWSPGGRVAGGADRPGPLPSPGHRPDLSPLTSYSHPFPPAPLGPSPVALAELVQAELLSHLGSVHGHREVLTVDTEWGKEGKRV